jgi:hypothetical protein
VTAPFLTAPNLGARHAFFTRKGGVSEGLYAALNGGVGSQDKPEHVAENRARMAAALGVAADHLLVPFQVHSADCLVVDAPWAERPRCDGLATTRRGLALGATGADCGMILFSAPGVIGACHAGWKGALEGMPEATIAAMERLGAQRKDIHAALGPCIGAASYEVGPEFQARFVARDAFYAAFFEASAKPDHFMFDLPGFLTMRLGRADIGSFINLARDTYAEPDLFFSYRRATHRSEPDYGRLVSAIVLE